MSGTLAEFNQLVDAEEYFAFFQLPYDPAVVSVNRLHILRVFSNRLKELEPTLDGASEQEKLGQYRTALQKAYEVFLSSTAQDQKLFKVFNDKPKNVVLLSEVKTSE